MSHLELPDGGSRELNVHTFEKDHLDICKPGNTDAMFDSNPRRLILKCQLLLKGQIQDCLGRFPEACYRFINQLELSFSRLCLMRRQVPAGPAAVQSHLGKAQSTILA
jgi:hypothetical protein